LSQKIQPTQDPLEEGAHGQGCGHNLLGTAAVASALAIKNWLQATGTPGTVRYYGCPAEEGGFSKTFMARAGAFDDLAVAFNFHPSKINMASKGSAVGVYNVKYRFHGRTSHAGGSPHLGRSALDAVELTNVGVNYLREHVLPSVRMHYVITNGGEAPNIVPDLAEVWYFLRAHQPEELVELVGRVRKVAQGAAMMTETRLEESFGSACASVLSNHYLADLQYAAMEQIGPIKFNEEEIAFAETINENYPPEMLQDSLKNMTEKLHIPLEKIDFPMLSENFPASNQNEVGGGSTDVGDTSWCTPVSTVTTTCFPMATPGHSWGIAASSGMSIGHKGMLHAAKIMAVAAMDCYADPTHIEKAREEFQKSTKDKSYKAMIPDDVVKPPIEVVSPAGSLPERYPECPFYDRDKR
jgi:aminobenzoyl-glutamate utilization protein B